VQYETSRIENRRGAEMNNPLVPLDRSKAAGPYIIVTDDDAHWYVIPKAALSKWDAWLLSEEAELGDIPNFSEAVGGSPSLVLFGTYIIE
jgi:hypothetical protein